MKLREMHNSIREMGAQIRQKSETLQAMALEKSPDFKKMDQISGEMKDLLARQKALKDAYRVEESAQGMPMARNILTAANVAEKEDKKMGTLNEIRSSNEYARAFAYALRNGLNRRTARGHEEAKILMDALTETGGSTPGEDGGFLVPIDIDNRINELKRDFGPLAPLFGAETVTAPTGWRVMATDPTTGMAKVEEMGTIGNNDQPVFAKVNYSVDKYADIVPVSNELLADEVANLFDYLARWFARKEVITENGLILTALGANVTPTAVGSGKIMNLLKTLLNKTLDPAISRDAVVICNQNGFDALDQAEDDMKRGLLQPDPTNATEYKVYGRPIHVFSNAVMASDVIYVGDGKQFGTMFTRQGFELASTDIGGNAWKTDSTEVRGIVRLGFSVFDAAAMAALSL